MRSFVAVPRLGLALGLVLTACGGGELASPPTTNASSGLSSPVPPSAGASASAAPSTGGPATPPVGSSTSEDPGPPPIVTPPAVAACDRAELGAPVFRLLTRFEFQNSVDQIFPGIAGKWTNSLPSNSLSSAGFDNDGAAVVGEQTAGGLQQTAESVGDAVASNLSSLLPCASAADAACAGQYLDTFGKRLFRRPLSAADRTRYLAVFDSALGKTDFKTAIKWVTAGLIQSPYSVYRSEIGVAQADGTRKLSAYELATQLAYMYTGSAPTAELLTQADAGTLADAVTTAKALLRTPGGHGVLQRFFEAYTGYSSAQSKQRPNASTNGVAYAQVSADMVQEARAFVDDVVFAQNGSLQELLTSKQTNPSKQLATFYGLPAPATDYAAVQRPADHGVGLLSEGAFLASHANADASSPTQRGVFAYTRLLCRQKPMLPDNVPPLGTPEPGTRTTRQRYEEVHAKPGTNCATCHSLFDPIGFAFEHFDEAGRYRADENGLPIDPTGKLNSSAGDAKAFTSQEELAQVLAGLPEVHACFAAYLATYAYGTSEKCLGSSQVAALQAGTLGIADAFAALAAEPHFTARSAE